jgi:hypothetical protein
MSYIPNSKGPREVSGRARVLVCGGADPAPGVEGASPIEPVAGTLASDRDDAAERACVGAAGINKLAISRQTLGRVLAGLPVRCGTLALVRAGLAAPNLRAVLEAVTGQAPVQHCDPEPSIKRRST